MCDRTLPSQSSPSSPDLLLSPSMELRSFFKHRQIAADESLALIDHYRIVRGALYKGFAAAAEVGDGNSLAFLAGRLHENFRDCGRLTGELQRGPLLNVQNNILVNPDYTRAITRIVSAVAPYPEAREAVVAALRDLDAASTSAPALTDRRDEGAQCLCTDGAPRHRRSRMAERQLSKRKARGSFRFMGQFYSWAFDA